jgi:hypothetical protein
MKKSWILISLLIISVAIWGCAHRKASTPSATTSAPVPEITPSPCGANLEFEWQHVYHPDRLVVREQCKVVTGVIDSVRSEPDGDFHVRLALDPGQENLLNDKNMSVQHGDLVIEPICEHPATQTDAVASCENFAGGVPRPRKGMHVRVAGSYVHDVERGHGWMEIHPAVLIQEIE